MKKVFIVSGILTGILLILIFAGVIDISEARRAALARGNRLLDSGNPHEAVQAYQKGLDKYPEDPLLNYNSGQALYQMGEYSQAAEHYGKSDIKKPDRYLNMGNSSLKLGDQTAADNAGVSLMYYQQALESYHQGILEFPEEIPLKYNYEYVLDKIQQLQQSMVNDQNSGNGQSGQNQQSGQNDQEGQDQQNDGDGQNDGNQQNSDNEQNGENDQSGQDGQNGETQQGSSHQGSSEQRQAKSVIENALEALEKAEADSLKRNQGNKYDYGENGYEW